MPDNEGSVVAKRDAATIDGSWTAEINAHRMQELDKIAWSSIFLHLSDSVIRRLGETTTVETLQAKL